MQRLETLVDQVAAESGLCGVVRVDLQGRRAVAKAYGMADRAHGIANTVDTQFGIASGTKGLTALTIMSLIEDRWLHLSTTARSVLGTDLALIGDDVTVEHLLAHRSGIGDYLDEEAVENVSDYVLSVPVHELATTEQYIAVLDGHPSLFAPDERFAYCNSGYVVLALIAERTTGTPFADLVYQRVCTKAGMPDTELLRSDELGGRAAIGYLQDEGLRTNVLHLPVRGSGDGGIYSTAADIHALWTAMFSGRLVQTTAVAAMIRPRSVEPAASMSYGLGFWLDESDGVVVLEGSDAGVSFRSAHQPDGRFTHTVLSNTSDGAWPMARELAQVLRNISL